jgi:hypothetical protein
MLIVKQQAYWTFPKNYPCKSGKWHDNKETEGKRSGNFEQEHLGVFLSHNTIPKAFGTPLARQVPSHYAVPDPRVFPLSKALQAACPMQDT